MRLTTGIAALALTLAAGAASAQGAREPIGTWQTEDDRARVKVDKCAQDKSAMCGTVVWLRDPLTPEGQPRTDPKNPDPAKRSRPALGMVIMSNFKPNNEGRFAGEIYNSDNGKNYDSSIALKSQNELDLKGCVLGGLFCGGQTWTRVADVPPPNGRQTSQRAP